jgi:hypothetical protein
MHTIKIGMACTTDTLFIIINLHVVSLLLPLSTWYDSKEFFR